MLIAISPELFVTARRIPKRVSVASVRSALATPSPSVHNTVQVPRGATTYPQPDQSFRTSTVEPVTTPTRRTLSGQTSGHLLSTSGKLHKGSPPHGNYADHRPLSASQNALLAIGSGIVGVLDTSRGDLVATLSEATATSFLPRLHDVMQAHPEGRQILRDRPEMSSKTLNLQKLRELKRGTLGREYVEWLHRNNVSPDTREQVRYIDSPTLAYTMLRYRQTHDLYHTLYSLPTSLPHELTLKAVELSNMSLPVAGLSSVFGPLRLRAARRAVWRQDWLQWALEVGRETRALASIYWEKRWEQGVGELRRELGAYRNDRPGVESRWKGYREVRQMERDLRKSGDWLDEPAEW